MGRTKMPPCGNLECGASTNIAEHASFGSGKLDDYGFWEKPCFICARSYEESTGGIAWPYTEKHIATLQSETLQDIINKVP